jgi:hypothetical protein
MHAHFGDPLVIDANYFNNLPQGKVGTACQEGYRVFDLDKPTKAFNITGVEIGRVQVKRTIHTKISDLNKGDNKLIKAAGFKSKEDMIRMMEETIYGKKIQWVTFVRFMPVVKLINQIQMP